MAPLKNEPFPHAIATSLRSPGVLATLMLPGRKNVFGTAKVDEPQQSAAGGLGEFLPASASVGLSKKQDASLLIPSLNMVLRVQVWPGETGSGANDLHFEYAGWNYLIGGPGVGQN